MDHSDPRDPCAEERLLRLPRHCNESEQCGDDGFLVHYSNRILYPVHSNEGHFLEYLTRGQV